MKFIITKCCRELAEAKVRIAPAEYGPVGFGAPVEVKRWGVYNGEDDEMKFCPFCGEKVEAFEAVEGEEDDCSSTICLYLASPYSHRSK